jgi:hypothetical protein
LVFQHEDPHSVDDARRLESSSSPNDPDTVSTTEVLVLVLAPAAAAAAAAEVVHPALHELYVGQRHQLQHVRLALQHGGLLPAIVSEPVPEVHVVALPPDRHYFQSTSYSFLSLCRFSNPLNLLLRSCLRQTNRLCVLFELIAISF